MYKYNGDSWLLYSKRCGRHYYHSNPLKSYPIVYVALISVCLETSSSKIGVQALQSKMYSIKDALPDFEDSVCQDDLADSC